MPPRPSWETIAYGPSWVPGERVIVRRRFYLWEVPANDFVVDDVRPSRSLRRRQQPVAIHPLAALHHPINRERVPDIGKWIGIE